MALFHSQTRRHYDNSIFRSKAVVLLLLIPRYMHPPLFVGGGGGESVYVLCFVMYYFVPFLALQSS